MGAVTLTFFSSVMAASSDSVPVSIPRDATWSLRLPKDDKVTYRGLVSFDDAGVGAGGMVYPAPSALGFLAAVFTHGAIVESQKQSQKNKLQEQADKVLAPYDSILKDFSHKELMHRALEKTTTAGNKKLVDSTDKAGTDWSIASIPIFSMTQDRSAIVLENAIALYPPNVTVPAYQNAVKVVSQPKGGAETDFWSANGGSKLKEESAGLLAHSLDIAIVEATNAPGKDSAQKTFRYLEGSAEKMERAQLISEHCNRVVIKTLRGWLMSVPARPSSDSPGTASCVDSATSASAK